MLWWDKKGDTTWICQIHPEGEGNAHRIIRVRVKYRLISIGSPVQPADRILRYPDDAQIHAWHKKTGEKAAPGHTSHPFPQVAEDNTPRLMDAAGECSL